MKKSTKILFWVGRCLLYLLIGLLIGTAVYSTAAKNISGDKLPMPLGVGAAVVLSGRMSPEFEAGDVVVVLKTQDVKKYDIVVFQRFQEGEGVELICHRVKEIDPENGTIITQGDANPSPDEPINREKDVKGKVLFSIPKAGFLVDLIKNPMVTIVIVILAVFLLNKSFRVEEKIAPPKKNVELEALRREIEALSGQLEETSTAKPEANTEETSTDAAVTPTGVNAATAGDSDTPDIGSDTSNTTDPSDDSE